MLISRSKIVKLKQKYIFKMYIIWVLYIYYNTSKMINYKYLIHTLTIFNVKKYTVHTYYIFYIGGGWYTIIMQFLTFL